jgi:predicted dehydrogenase
MSRPSVPPDSRSWPSSAATALTSLDEALALPGLDAVSIATPPETHLPLVLRAVEAGRHVLCEKPFALNTTDAAQMLAAADKAGVVHFLGTEFRFATAQAHLTRVIGEGLIGEPRLATFLLHIPLLADPSGEIPGWWGSEAAGGGWLGAQGSHLVDQIRTTLGEFCGVSAGLTRLSGRPEMTADDTFTVHFRAGTADGIMQSSASSWGRLLLTTRIAGTEGTVWLNGEDVWLGGPGGDRRLEAPEDLRLPPPTPPRAEFLNTAYDLLHFTGMDLEPYTRLASAFLSRIHGGTPAATDPVPATFADGLAAVQVLEAIRRSSADHTWQSLE